jgi:hypothetical protein
MIITGGNARMFEWQKESLRLPQPQRLARRKGLLPAHADSQIIEIGLPHPALIVKRAASALALIGSDAVKSKFRRQIGKQLLARGGVHLAVRDNLEHLHAVGREVFEMRPELFPIAHRHVFDAVSRA